MSHSCPDTFISNSTLLSPPTTTDNNTLAITHESSTTTTNYATTTNKKLSSNFFCYCGGEGSNHNNTTSTTSSNLLQWVSCSRCGQIMHGICAGFTSHNDLITNSISANPTRLCSERHCPFCQYELTHPNSNTNSVGNGGDDNLIGSRATLIVTPPAILNQWEREIQRHTRIESNNNDDDNTTTRPLKVLVYPGVKSICAMSNVQKLQSGAMKMLQPNYLADADSKFTCQITKVG